MRILADLSNVVPHGWFRHPDSPLGRNSVGIKVFEMSFFDAFLLTGFLIIFFNTVLWLVSLILKDASIIDPCWGLLFLIAGVNYFLIFNNGFQWRPQLLLGLVILWSLRLSLYLAWRNWGEEEDFRYQKWRRENGPRWWWFSYFKVFLRQGVIAWIISTPMLAVHAAERPLNLLDFLGVAFWLLGFLFETVGDWQMARFRNHPENRGKVLNKGVWALTRHPNYFGEAAQWWGFFLLAAAAGGFWTVYAPLLMTFLLLKVSGVVMLEESLVAAKPHYRRYMETTSSFVPWFPGKNKS